MHARWHKVRGDLRLHRGQIAWIALLLTLGTAAVLATWNARLTLRREIARSFASAVTADVLIDVEDAGEAQCAALRAHPAVAGVEPLRSGLTRALGARGEWLPLRLTVKRDFAAQEVGLVHQHGGDWADAGRGLYVEQSSLPLLGLAPGQPLRVRAPDGGIVEVPVAGTVHDPAIAPGAQEQIIYAYATPAVAETLGQGGPLNRLAVRLRGREALWRSDVVAELRSALAATGARESRSEVLSRQHPHAVLMNAMLQVLGVLAGLAFACSAALAGYLVSLWMKRELRQVGILKSIGATSGQLAAQYLALVAPVVLLATAAAFPLGAWLGEFLLRYHETQLNIDLLERAPSWSLLGLEALVAVSVPLGAMALPILRAARLPVREALQDPGITAQSVAVSGWRARLSVPGSREWTLPVRNVLRRPWRLAVTLGALTLGGGLYLAASFLYASLMGVVDASLARLGYDLQLQLRRPLSAPEWARLAAPWREVERTEVWRRSSVRFGRVGRDAASHETHGTRGLVVAHASGSDLQRLPATQGRWPRADEADAVLIGRPARTALQAHLGDVVWIEAGERGRREFRVVGEFEEFGGPSFYVVGAAADALLGPLERSATLTIRAQPGRLAAALEEIELACLAARLDVANLETRQMRREAMAEHFLGVVGVSHLVAAAAALFGGISLAAFGCLAVLERSREIGILRALGATTARIGRLFLAESAVVVLASSLAALLFGLGVARLLNHLIETRAFLLAIPLRLDVAALGVLASGLVVVLAFVALTVHRLVCGTVRETLSYE